MDEKTGTSSHAALGWWQDHVAGAVDHREVMDRAREEGVWSGHFAFMTVTSAGIAILGLLLSSPAVVIGAMLISPLMGPILAFGFGLALFDLQEIRRALLTLGLGIGLAVLISALIVLLSPLQSITSEIAARTRPNLFDLGVAVLSGLAGTYAMIRGRHGAIVGVAIAVAVMPPLAVMGFGLATWNLSILTGAAFLFITNLMAIGFTAAVLARVYGFGRSLSPKQTWVQVSLVAATFVALAIPLGLALRQIAWETLASRQAREAIAGRFDDAARVTQLEINYDSNPIHVSAVVFTPAYRGGAEGEAANALREALGRPVDVSVEQVRIGNADPETTQLADARGAAADRTAERLGERLALIAGVGPADVLIDREHRIARVRAAALPGATIRAYQELEARVAASEQDWRIVLVPPPAALPDVPAPSDPPSAQFDAAIAATLWGWQRLRLPVGVSGEAAPAVVARLTEAGVEARATGARTGPVHLIWLAPAL